MRVAAVDIGTNTTLMLVAESSGGGASIEVRAIEDHAEITRLGRGVDENGVLGAEAMARTVSALQGYCRRAKQLGVDAIAAIATSAVRDANNRAQFCLLAKHALGVNVEIASGAREAALTFHGALGGLAIDPLARLAVIDVGGGSTEIVVGCGRDGIEWANSYDVGSVRLTERHVRNDPPSANELSAIEQSAASAFAQSPAPRGPFAHAVAIAGTSTTYAAIDLQLANYSSSPPHGHFLANETLQTLVESLGREPLGQREKRIGLDPRRADVIVAGGIVLLQAAKSIATKGLTISDRGLRWGLARELIARTG